MFCLLPKSFVSVHFHCVAPFMIKTGHCCFKNLNCKQIVCSGGGPIEVSHLIEACDPSPVVYLKKEF